MRNVFFSYSSRSFRAKIYAMLVFALMLVSIPLSLFAASRESFTPELTWQWQLSGALDLSYNVDVYDVDLDAITESQIEELHSRGSLVVCYFSAGTLEDFRASTQGINPRFVGKQLEDWPDERWLDIRYYSRFKSILISRLNLAQSKNCDAVEPDNVDAYANDTGFNITKRHQLIFNKWLSKNAHSRGLAIGLKNDLDQVKQLERYFDFAVNEQCFQYEECNKLLPFIKKNKAVFGVEYELEKEEFCSKARALRFSWLKMDYELDGGRVACE